MDQLTLTSAVGSNQPNLPGDVKLVQRLLNRHAYATHITLVVDGHFGARTLTAIRAFQSKVLAMHLPDGVVGVHGLTISRLQTSSISPVTAPTPAAPASGVAQTSLTEEDYKQAATALGCEVAAIKAVAEVESKRGAFDAEGRPSILYERHIFSKHTKHLYDKTHPEISAPTGYGKGGYGSFNAQYAKLEAASKLDSSAALMAASWGQFQIMGESYDLAGFKTVEEFVAAMRRSVADHLTAFVNFIKNKKGALPAIRKKDWAGLAYAYNGSGYKAFEYDTKLAAAYAKYSK